MNDPRALLLLLPLLAAEGACVLALYAGRSFRFKRRLLPVMVVGGAAALIAWAAAFVDLTTAAVFAAAALLFTPITLNATRICRRCAAFNPRSFSRPRRCSRCGAALD